MIMTFSTNSNHVKPMSRFITGVVILLCLFIAIMTFKVFCFRYFAISNSITYSNSRPVAFRIANAMAFMSDSLSDFTFLALTITFSSSFAFFALFIKFSSSFIFFCLAIMSFSFLMSNFPFFCLGIFLVLFLFTVFTIILMTVRLSPIFVKLRKRLNLLASTTVFCLNNLSHNVLSLQKNVLVRAEYWYVPAIGSLYYNRTTER